MNSKFSVKLVKICKRLWNSPTFTTWGNYGAQSLRLLLVTPLILTRFNETEIAAWYLFASLNFFGTTISQRLGLTFTRMFAFAIAGASNLAPIKGRREQENGGKPNWSTFEKAYGTISSVNLGLVGVNALLALGMGWFGLSNLLQGYSDKSTIWFAFGLLQLGSLTSFVFQRYRLALQGMNYVSLVNRWGIIFALLSVISGSITLWLDGGIIMLVLVMQLFSVMGIVRNHYLLKVIENGRVLKFAQYGFNREVFNWAWEPTWKGLINNLSFTGLASISGVMLTQVFDARTLASYLFSLRMMEVITQISQAPFASLNPLFSKLRASGEITKLKTLVISRARLSLTLLIIGAGAICVVISISLNFIDSSIAFLDTNTWLLLVGLTVLQRFNILCGSVAAIGNVIPFVWSYLSSLLVSVALLGWAMKVLPQEYLVIGVIIAIKLPAILILSYRPAILTENILLMPRLGVMKGVLFSVFISYVVISCIVYAIT